MQVWRRIQQSLEKQRRAALISVVKVEGSAPREVGARMVIQKDAGFFGTIGGGRRERVETPSAPLRVSRLGPHRGQCCGGSVTTLIETFDSVDLADIRELAAAEEA